jgi:hypothetical protein
MKKIIILCIVLVFAASAFGQQQNLIVLKPKINTAPDLSEKRQRELEQRDKVIEKLRKGASADALTPQERELLEKLGESEDSSIWDTMDQGCSWYCGGGPYKITASSALKPSGSITYEAKNAHDFSFKTTWVEGVPGYGEGEYLEYFFENKSPRVTDILIYNGYLKNEAGWKKNSRVKKLKLWVNGKPYAVLELQDTRALQTFKLNGPLGRTKDDKDLILKFEILEVYKGDAYDDTAITEIYFDGLDVHCLAKGTKIAMEHAEKPIETLAVGDRVKQFDIKKSELTSATVTRVIKAIHSHLLTLKLENGSEIVTTEDHPFRIAGKGWCSYKPGKSQTGSVGRYGIGDAFLIFVELKGAQQARLREIIKGNSTAETFTLELDSGESFIGNGFIIGTEHAKE